MEKYYKILSANKMAEYLDAKALRRAQIVAQQKSDLGHHAQYYVLAQVSGARVISSGDPATALEIEKQIISNHQGWGNHPAQLIANNLQAFSGLMSCVNNYDLRSNRVTFRKPTQTLSPRIFGDVRLSNRFDIETVITGRKLRYGGIKFYLNKKHPLSSFSGAVLASMLVDAAGDTYGKKAVSPDNVIIIDAFQGKIFSRPAQMKRHLEEASAAAREFSIHWDSIP